MKTYALRLHPGQDLFRELVATSRDKNLRAGFVLTCVGSLREATLRLANQPSTSTYVSYFEIVSLVGTLSPDGAHLHISISDSNGKTYGGHLMPGCVVYTTAEIVLGELEDVRFTRPFDPQTGFDELSVG